MKHNIAIGLALTLLATPLGCGDDEGGTGGTAASGTTASNTMTGSMTGSMTNTMSNTTPNTMSNTMSNTNSATEPTTNGSGANTGTDTDAATGGATDTGVGACPYTPVDGEQTLGFEEVASGFQRPVLVVGDPVNLDVIYVVEQPGRINRIEPGVTSPPADVWFNVPGVSQQGDEDGLLGLAFHPDYPAENLIYVSYTIQGSGGLIVTEFEVNAGVVDEASGRHVIAMGQPQTNHNGGMIAFGPDGLMYVSVGDGGVQNDGCGHGQDGSLFLGKMLRIDPAADGEVDATPPCGCFCSEVTQQVDYTVPADNPFVGDPSVHDAIYATGFRNPWRFSFDAADGTLFLGDVGQGEWEEIDVVVAGGNYGWGDMEGAHCFNNGCTVTEPGSVNPDGLTMPVAEYGHTGGFVLYSVISLGTYRSCEVPAWAGKHFYGDYGLRDMFAVSWDGMNASADGKLGTAPADILGGGTNGYGDVFMTATTGFGGPGAGVVYRLAPQ